MNPVKYIKRKIEAVRVSSYTSRTFLKNIRQFLHFLLPPILILFFYYIVNINTTIKIWKKSKLITVKIRDLYSPAFTPYKTLAHLKKGLKNPDNYFSKKELEYNWERLKNSIQTYGVINPIIVSIQPNNLLHKYYIEDGNHRYFMCKILYGLDHKILIKTY
jgi:hypothetical protein